MVFALDARLKADTVLLGQLPLSYVLLHKDSRFPWLILVPAVAGCSETIQLSDEQQQQLCIESAAIARIVQHLWQPDRINTGKLGNIVEQLHIHHIARFSDDAAWPGPVWGHGKAAFYSPEQLIEVKSKLLEALTALADFDATVGN